MKIKIHKSYKPIMSKLKYTHIRIGVLKRPLRNNMNNLLDLDKFTEKDIKKIRSLPIKCICFWEGHPNNLRIAEYIGARVKKLPAVLDNMHIFGKTIPSQFIHFIFSCFFETIRTKKKNGLIYFCESIAPSLFPIMMRFFKNENNIIICRINDETFNYENKGWLTRTYYKRLYNNLNGIIGVTPMVIEDSKGYVDCPKENATLAMWRPVSYFSKNHPDFKFKNFAFLGEYRLHKGPDLLAKALILLKKKVKFKFKTYFIGSGIKENLKKLNLLDDSFIFTGKVKDPRPFLNRCSFLAHIARYDTGPTSVLEAMASGIIPFVSYKTGSKNRVINIDKRLIINSLNPEVIADQMADFLNATSTSNLKQMSKKCCEEIRKNNINKSLYEYGLAFKRILIKNDRWPLSSEERS